MDSEIGLIIQLAGILLITLLLVFLTKSLKSTALRYWKYAWLSMGLALFSLYAAFEFPSIAKPFFTLYYLGEYAFAYLLIAGCRNYVSDEKITARSCLIFTAASVPAAVFLSFPSGGLDAVFNFHSFIMAAAFAVAFFAFRSPAKFSGDNCGWRVMKTALALLAIDFFHYTIIFSLRHTSYPQLLGKYLGFNSIIDLVLEILLGFGMVIVLLERVRQDVEESNRKLKHAHDKLEQLAHIDPLTAAFTRHAFYSFLQNHDKETGTVSGCVGVFDIDNLKPINDRFGHTVGDVAISRVAHAIRSLVRADDLIFRWGGDEFFVVMLGCNSEQSDQRLGELNELLKDIKLFGAAEEILIGVSFGFADFSDINDLEKSVKTADAEMYRAKQRNKCADKNAPGVLVRTMPTEISTTLH